MRQNWMTRLAEAELPHDFAASVRIAEWAYEQTEQAKGQVWVSQGCVSPFGAGVAAVVGGVTVGQPTSSEVR